MGANRISTVVTRAVPPPRAGYTQKWVPSETAEDLSPSDEWSIRTDPGTFNWFDLVLVEKKIIRCPEESYNCQDVQDDYADAIAYAESYTIDSEEVADEVYDWDDPELHYHGAHLAVHEMAAQTLQAWNRGPARALIRIERDIHRVRFWQDVALVILIVTAALALVLWTR